MAWGDIDNDGALDILINGNEGNSREARIYRNNGGVFAASARLAGLGVGSAALGDYDNDGDLDILLTGMNINTIPVTKLYRNDNCADVVVHKTAAPTSVAPGAPITYTLSFTNNGPAVALAVVLGDLVPNGVTISGVTSSTADSGVVIVQTSGSPNFAWAVSDLPVGAGGVITLAGTLNPALAVGAVVTNTATIGARNDVTTTNNSSSAAVTVDLGCMATPNNGATVFASADAQAVQQLSLIHI